MNFFDQGVPLGRWFGIRVLIHWTFFIYALYLLRGADDGKLTLLFVFLLFATVLLHEFGHALACRAVGGKAERIILWPLGGIAFVNPPPRVTAWLVTTVCGPLVNAVLWPVSYFLLNWSLHRWPPVEGPQAVAGIQWLQLSLAYMLQINKALLLFNLLPSYPMDGGRILQELLWSVIGLPMSLMLAGVVGVGMGILFIAVNLNMVAQRLPLSLQHLLPSGSGSLLMIGVLCIAESIRAIGQSNQIRRMMRESAQRSGPTTNSF